MIIKRAKWWQLEKKILKETYDRNVNERSWAPGELP